MSYKKGSILGPVIETVTTKDYVTIHVPPPKTDDRASKYIRARSGSTSGAQLASAGGAQPSDLPRSCQKTRRIYSRIRQQTRSNPPTRMPKDFGRSARVTAAIRPAVRLHMNRKGGRLGPRHGLGQKQRARQGGNLRHGPATNGRVGQKQRQGRNLRHGHEASGRVGQKQRQVRNGQATTGRVGQKQMHGRKVISGVNETHGSRYLPSRLPANCDRK